MRQAIVPLSAGFSAIFLRIRFVLQRACNLIRLSPSALFHSYNKKHLLGAIAIMLGVLLSLVPNFNGWGVVNFFNAVTLTHLGVQIFRPIQKCGSMEQVRNTGDRGTLSHLLAGTPTSSLSYFLAAIPAALSATYKESALRSQVTLSSRVEEPPRFFSSHFAVLCTACGFVLSEYLGDLFPGRCSVLFALTWLLISSRVVCSLFWGCLSRLLL